MNKSFFTLICGFLMCVATMTVQAQNGLSVEKCNIDDSALNDKDSEIRKLAIAKSTDQGVFRHVALNDKDPEIRKLAIARSTDQGVFRHVALNDKDSEIRKLAIARSTDQGVFRQIGRAHV